MTSAETEPPGSAPVGNGRHPGGGRRILLRAGIVLGVVLVVAGAVVGYLGYEKSAGPAGAVRSYFSALQAGDAPQALGWGTVPDGSHALLTSTVLQIQQRIAPIEDVRIGAVERSGSHAVVHVAYTLAFDSGDIAQKATVGVVERDGDWRLRAVAIPTQLILDDAARRATVAGVRVPQSATLVFPGAPPVTFDSPYLELDPAQDTVGFGADSELDVAVQVSSAGRTAVQAAVGRALTVCVTGGADLSCPVPSDRYVPGSLRGTLSTAALDQLDITLGSGPDGAINVDGTIPFTGTYRKLTFANRAKVGHGHVEIHVHATAYAVTPLAVVWSDS